MGGRSLEVESTRWPPLPGCERPTFGRRQFEGADTEMVRASVENRTTPVDRLGAGDKTPTLSSREPVLVGSKPY